MLTGRALASFRKSLLGWFRQFQRDLPWRESKDPYRVWLSEIMLQQTRVAAVIPYYERFLERFPDVHALANAPEEEVLRLWSGLGYYSRARNLQKAASQVVAEFGGVFPNTREKILLLSGIGAYTASAIASIAFEEKCAVLDGNVARVLSRLDVIQGDLHESKKWQDLQDRADRLLDPGASGDWNQAMMELGATVCTPRSPQCLLCPVAKHCEGRKKGIAESLPKTGKKQELVDVALVALVLVNPKGETLLLPPPSIKNPGSIPDHIPTLVANLWHFPTASAKGDPRETAGETWKKINRGQKFPRQTVPLQLVRHAVTFRKVTVHGFLVPVPKLPKIEGSDILDLRQVTNRAVSNLTRKIADRGLAAMSAKRQ
jgi:A/G-specific adenine glycosylase